MSMPNLERGGWEPGLRWVADSPEQQKELDVRYDAEDIADRAHFLMAMHGEEEEDDLWDREEEVQKCITMVLAIESYNSRPLAGILRDMLSWIEVAQDDSDRYHTQHTLERESSSLLTRVAEYETEKNEIDPELLSLSIKWAAVEYFTYHHFRYWEREVTREDCLGTIGKAGLTAEELDDILQIPMNAEAEQMHNENGEMYIHAVNQRVLESQMLKRAKEVGVEVGKVHGYGNVMQNLGF